MSSNARRATGRAALRNRARPVRKGQKPQWGRIALVVGVALALCGGLGSCLYYKGVESSLAWTDPFSALTNGRPPKNVKGVQNILLAGTDMADPDSAADDPGQARTDTIILLHIPSSHDHAYLVSIPRDTWVPVPQKATDSRCGNRYAKINAAYAWGGLPLLVRAAECFTKVHVDHVVQIDFAGFKQVVDALGGVDMPIEAGITSIHPPYRKFTKGTMHLNGEEALDYVRQRKQFPEGDFARMRHQQQLLKILLDTAASGQTLTNPIKFNNFVSATTKAVKVDRDFQLLDMALQFRGLRSENLTFLTSPYSGTQDIGDENVVVPDEARASALYKAINRDKMAEWARVNASPSPTRSNR
jgi:LCP family protein required for cell wall assembly